MAMAVPVVQVGVVRVLVLHRLVAVHVAVRLRLQIALTPKVNHERFMAAGAANFKGPKRWHDFRKASQFAEVMAAATVPGSMRVLPPPAMLNITGRMRG